MFRIQASAALESVFAFAEFVERTESLFDSHENGDFVRRYNDAWFELEMVNAVALADWEDDGRPAHWDDKWEKKYKMDASEVVDELVRLIEARA